MRIRVTPGSRLSGTTGVPGDKSISHRWLILAATARGPSRLVGLPSALDVRSTAACLARVTVKPRPALDLWARNASSWVKGSGSTWNDASTHTADPTLEVEGDGYEALRPSDGPLDCGNSGTSMRSLTGVLSASPFRSVLTGDPSLTARPMDRVAAPLRRMGASIATTDGHAPVTVDGGPLHGVRHVMDVPTAQVKGAILFAGVRADGETVVVEPVATRDHTERALEALGAGVRREGLRIAITRFQHGGFEASVPGDVSSAAFVVAAAALTGSELTIEGVGLNPTRLRFLDVMQRMGIATQTEVTAEHLGEPTGSIHVRPPDDLRGTSVGADELPLVIDEIPVLAMLAAHARTETWFLGAGELRVKESDRLSALADGIRGLGGHAAAEGDDLVIAGGGLRGGVASSAGDHRLAMAFVVGAFAADRPCDVDGAEAADVSFPGFVSTLASLGAAIEAER